MTADPTPTSIIASLRARLDAVSDLADHLVGNEAAPLIREALNGYVPTGDLDPTPATGADQGEQHFHVPGCACGTEGAPYDNERDPRCVEWSVIQNAALAARLADERERIAQAIEDECPHEPDEHPEGCCEVCDYAFAAANIAREGGQHE